MERLQAHKKLAEELAWTQSLLTAAQRAGSDNGASHAELAESKREVARLLDQLAQVELRAREDAALEISRLQVTHREELDYELAAAEDRKRAALNEQQARIRLEVAEAIADGQVMALCGGMSIAELRATATRAKATTASLEQQHLMRAHARASKTANEPALLPLSPAKPPPSPAKPTTPARLPSPPKPPSPGRSPPIVTFAPAAQGSSFLDQPPQSTSRSPTSAAVASASPLPAAPQPYAHAVSETRAATRVQAVTRGRNSRKAVMIRAHPAHQAAPSLHAPPTAHARLKEAEDAATRVQAVTRGRNARARSHGLRAAPAPPLPMPPPPPPSDAPPPLKLWREASTADGTYYYEVDTMSNKSTGEVTWDAPPPELMWAAHVQE